MNSILNIIFLYGIIILLYVFIVVKTSDLLVGMRPGSKLVLLLLPIMVSDMVLIVIIVLNLTTTQFPILNDDKTSLTFDGKSYFQDGNLKFLVDNNGKGSLKILYSYGLDAQDTVNSSSSYLVDDTHKINADTKLTIKPNNTIVADAKLYNIKVPPLQNPGSYQGWIFVSGKDNIPIPVTVATEPKVVVALLLVIIGIFTSIIFWEIIKYVDQLKKAQTEPDIQGKPNIVDSIAAKVKSDAAQVMNVAQNRMREQPNLNTEEGRLTKTIQNHITEEQLNNYLNKKLTSKAFVKVSIIDLGTIGFGIAVGFLALLSQGYVTGIRVIGTTEVLALVGLGLGIGSLREFLNKDSQQ
jgi:hypothetical protein